MFRQARTNGYEKYSNNKKRSGTISPYRWIPDLNPGGNGIGDGSSERPERSASHDPPDDDKPETH
jgi:hypothetical protein